MNKIFKRSDGTFFFSTSGSGEIDLGVDYMQYSMLEEDEKNEYLGFLNNGRGFAIFKSEFDDQEVWVVAPEDDTDFWMGSWETKSEATNFLKRLGLKSSENES